MREKKQWSSAGSEAMKRNRVDKLDKVNDMRNNFILGEINFDILIEWLENLGT